MAPGMSREPPAKRDPGFGGLQSFAGACLLTGALLLPHAPLWSVLAGMALAAVVRWTWQRYSGPG
jgi:hypothetical protein